MKYFITIVVFAVVGLIGLIAFSDSTPATNANQQTKTSIQSIKSDIETGAKLVDVRTPEEYAAGHIDGSINLPLQDIQAGSVNNLPKDKNIYVYCRSGSRSAQASAKLKAEGFSNITDLGAMSEVQSLGGKIIK